MVWEANFVLPVAHPKFSLVKQLAVLQPSYMIHRLGLIATNEWPEELQGQVRFISVEQEEGSHARLIRFEATEAVVQLIQEEGGTISIGSDSATIRNNKKPVKRGTNIVYRLQK